MSNEGARKLYQRFGFAPVGVRKDYYSSPREDAVVLVKNRLDVPLP